MTAVEAFEKWFQGLSTEQQQEVLAHVSAHYFGSGLMEGLNVGPAPVGFGGLPAGPAPGKSKVGGVHAGPAPGRACPTCGRPM